MFWRRSHSEWGGKIRVPYGPSDPGCHTVHFLLQGRAASGGHLTVRGASEEKPSQGYTFLCSSWRKVMGM